MSSRARSHKRRANRKQRNSYRNEFSDHLGVVHMAGGYDYVLLHPRHWKIDGKVYNEDHGGFDDVAEVPTT